VHATEQDHERRVRLRSRWACVALALPLSVLLLWTLHGCAMSRTLGEWFYRAGLPEIGSAHLSAVAALHPHSRAATAALELRASLGGYYAAQGSYSAAQADRDFWDSYDRYCASGGTQHWRFAWMRLAGADWAGALRIADAHLPGAIGDEEAYKLTFAKIKSLSWLGRPDEVLTAFETYVLSHPERGTPVLVQLVFDACVKLRGTEQAHAYLLDAAQAHRGTRLADSVRDILNASPTSLP
jgi:hypothetical protein